MIKDWSECQNLDNKLCLSLKTLTKITALSFSSKVVSQTKIQMKVNYFNFTENHSKSCFENQIFNQIGRKQVLESRTAFLSYDLSQRFVF